MEPSSKGEALPFETLKAKHRAIRDDFPQSLSLRVHRALSWLNRAEMEQEDLDASFIFLWIAFNAAYADELSDAVMESERSVFEEYFRKLSDLDAGNRIYNVIWERFPQAIRLLLRAPRSTDHGHPASSWPSRRTAKPAVQWSWTGVRRGPAMQPSVRDPAATWLRP